MSISKRSGGMPGGRYKRGSLGPKRVKVEFATTPEEKRLIHDAAEFHTITVSQYCARAAVAAAKNDLSRKLRQ
jgi:uncharacterized protein (DUF1778 family)